MPFWSFLLVVVEASLTLMENILLLSLKIKNLLSVGVP